MKHVMFFLFLGLSLSIIAQTEQDSSKLNTRYEYITIIIETAGSGCDIFIAKDSLKCVKKSLKNDESYNLTEVVKMLSVYNKEGWLVLNSNFTLAGNSPFHSYLYYLLYRKKR